MSAHDRAAARDARKHSFRVVRFGPNHVQVQEFHGLTDREAEARKAYEREARPGMVEFEAII